MYLCVATLNDFDLDFFDFRACEINELVISKLFVFIIIKKNIFRLAAVQTVPFNGYFHIYVVRYPVIYDQILPKVFKN